MLGMRKKSFVSLAFFFILKKTSKCNPHARLLGGAIDNLFAFETITTDVISDHLLLLGT